MKILCRIFLTMSLIFAFGCSASPIIPAPTPDTFMYPVQVIDKISIQSISFAKVTIQVSTSAPYEAVTGTDGFFRVALPSKYANQQGVLKVEANGYKLITQDVDLIPDLAIPKVIIMEPVNADIIETTPLTPTPFPQPTSTVTPTISLPFYCLSVGTSFKDDFSSPNSGWRITKSEDGEGDYVAGEFKITVFKGNTGIISGHGAKECYNNFDMQVDIRRADEHSAGYASIQFGKVDNNYYELRIYTSGAPGVRLFYRASNSSEALTPILGAFQIKTGKNTNTIRLRLNQNILDIYVNEEIVQNFVLEDPRWGEIYFLGCTCGLDEGGAIYYFDNFSILSLDNSSN